MKMGVICSHLLKYLENFVSFIDEQLPSARACLHVNGDELSERKGRGAAQKRSLRNACENKQKKGGRPVTGPGTLGWKGKREERRVWVTCQAGW